MLPGSVFLSHAGEDNEAAKQLARELRTLGADVWLDAEKLRPGDLWMEEIESAIGNAAALIVYVGRSGIQRWVDNEVRVALSKNARDRTFRLIPVLGPESNPDALPLFLRQFQWLDVRSTGVTAATAHAILSRATSESQRTLPILPPDRPPFRGLLAFDVEDGLLFHGRDREIQALLQGLRCDPLLAVVGDSGGGKSSLVRAGLIPTLYRGRFHDGHNWSHSWRIAVLRPGESPLVELAESMHQLDPPMAPFDRLRFSSDVAQLIRHNPDCLHQAVAAIVPRGTRSLLVVDQFEELFTIAKDSSERNLFVDALLEAAREHTEHPVHVVLVLRADFYSHCWEFPRLWQRLAVNQVAVRRMHRQQLRDAIEKPLALIGATAEPGLIDAILSDVGEEPGNLPLLEHALLQLWERSNRCTLTHDAYREIGRLSGALKNYADQVYFGLPSDSHRSLARKIFMRLTQPGERTPDTRRRATKKELLSLTQRGDDVEAVLTSLITSRLVTASQISAQTGTYESIVEVAHEALIREWPRMREWVNENRESLRVERRLLLAVEEWSSSHCDPGMLLRGAKLSEAEKWMEDHPHDLPPSASTFIEASIRLREEEQRRDRQLLQAGLEARSRELASQSERQLGVDLRTALSLAIQAGKSAETVEAEGALWRALTMERLTAIFRHDTPVNHAVFSPDGVLIATTNVDGSAQLWDVRTGHQLHVLRGHKDEVHYVAFSPDGARIATASDDQTVRIWEIPSGRQLQVLRGHEAWIECAAFSPDGALLVTASDDRTTRIWDVESGTQLHVLRGHRGVVNHATLSPDGSIVITSSSDKTSRIWDVVTGKHLHFLTGHGGAVLRAAVSPDGASIATAATDGTVHVWNVSDGQLRHVFRGAKGAISDVVYSPDGSRILCTNEYRFMFMLDAKSGKLLHTINVLRHGPVHHATFSPDGVRVIAASYDKVVRVWHALTGRELFSLEGHRAEVYHAEFSTDGTRVVTASHDRTVRVWDVPGRWGLDVLQGHQGPVQAAAFSPDGRRLATEGHDKMLRIWDAETGRELSALGDRRTSIEHFSFSPDGLIVVTAGGDGLARVWNVLTGAELLCFRGHKGSVTTAYFLEDGLYVLTASRDKSARLWRVSDGRQMCVLHGHRGRLSSGLPAPGVFRAVTTSSDGTARMWDLKTAAQLFVLEGHTAAINYAAFSRDGSKLVTTSDDETARVWSARDGSLLHVLQHHQDIVRHAAFSPDGTRVATASKDYTARIWNVDSGSEVHVLQGHSQAVGCVRFSPDGFKLVTASLDKTARLWDVYTGREIRVLQGHQGPVLDASFSRDGSRIVTASSDRTARIYFARFTDLLALAEKRLRTT